MDVEAANDKRKGKTKKRIEIVSYDYGGDEGMVIKEMEIVVAKCRNYGQSCKS